MRKHFENFIGRNSAAALFSQTRSGEFHRDERGSVTILSVFLFLIILMVAGIGVDLMRYERDRAILQSTLDRAVLAAADLDQKLPPTEVVSNYLDKAGLSGKFPTPTVNSGIGYRKVTANAQIDVPTFFMHLSGVDMLNAPALSSAEESIGGVEISLILDVSGSMNSYSRLTNLKVAAKDFVDQMVNNTEDGKLSISIVPYATQVSVPQNIFSQYNTTGTNNYSRCINFAASDFNATAISQTAPLQRTMHFDPWQDTDRRDNGQFLGQSTNTNSYYGRPVCEAWASREIMPFQKNATTLKNYIDSFVARGNTSLDIGMKWGTAMLDPAFRPVVNSLIAAGDVDAGFNTRPANYNSGDTLKVIVLMTDGNNTSQYYIDENYRSGMSNIWWNAQEKVYSVYDPQSDSYYWPDYDDLNAYRWQDHPYGNDNKHKDCNSYSCWTDNEDEPGEAVRLDYPELWARTSLKFNVQEHYYPWMNDSTARSIWEYGVRSYYNDTIKDVRTKAICDAAKAGNKGIILYTIAFEAPSEGKAVLKYCASSDSHYYDVKGLEISDAFASIASSIRKLRLTQ
ncbi:hypothetical protein FGK63_11360 [Ruegeria sediminis]|uniref:Putative Flp pilus-assembly TadG-like N-terminal domain-containing protein n=1 Tax=Ruegeria sediminis TaxID=2583820 RepID=A0ABY2WYU1_9RHOB|nr:TadE/TadG family type IV pilus assembly protein [Ruegeria sediminis]TMV08037.1 hypothetical protein FGK63_11360 [Ruegeria sediminis]